MYTLEEIKALGEQDQYPATVYRYCSVKLSMFGGYCKESGWRVRTFEFNRYKKEVQPTIIQFKTLKEAMKAYSWAVRTENKCWCNGIKHGNCCNQK